MSGNEWPESPKRQSAAPFSLDSSWNSALQKHAELAASAASVKSALEAQASQPKKQAEQQEQVVRSWHLKMVQTMDEFYRRLPELVAASPNCRQMISVPRPNKKWHQSARIMVPSYSWSGHISVTSGAARASYWFNAGTHSDWELKKTVPYSSTAQSHEIIVTRSGIQYMSSGEQFNYRLDNAMLEEAYDTLRLLIVQIWTGHGLISS